MKLTKLSKNENNKIINLVNNYNESLSISTRKTQLLISEEEALEKARFIKYQVLKK